MTSPAPFIALLVAAALYTHGRAEAQPLPGVVLPPAIPALSSAPLPPTLDASFPQGIRLTEFARVVLQDVLKQPFIFSTDFLQSPASVGFSAKELKARGSEALLRDVLGEHGFRLQFASGYYRVSAIKEADKPDLREDFYYRPRHRDLAYLSRILQPLFPQGGFTYQRESTPPQQPQQTQQLVQLLPASCQHCHQGHQHNRLLDVLGVGHGGPPAAQCRHQTRHLHQGGGHEENQDGFEVRAVSTIFVMAHGLYLPGRIKVEQHIDEAERGHARAQVLRAGMPHGHVRAASSDGQQTVDPGW